MKSLSTFLILYLLAVQSYGQTVIEKYISQTDSLRIGKGKGDFLPYNDRGYTLILPDTTKIITGILVSFEDRKHDLNNNKQQIYQEATAKNIAVLYVSTGIPLDLFFSELSLNYIDTTLKNVFTRYRLPNKNIFFL